MLLIKFIVKLRGNLIIADEIFGRYQSYKSVFKSSFRMWDHLKGRKVERCFARSVSYSQITDRWFMSPFCVNISHCHLRLLLISKQKQKMINSLHCCLNTIQLQLLLLFVLFRILFFFASLFFANSIFTICYQVKWSVFQKK